jgi:hypothetical protein
VAISGELATVSGQQATIGEGASPSTGPDVRRLTGVAGLAPVLLALGQFPLYMQGDPSVSAYDGAALGRELFGIRNVVFHAHPARHRAVHSGDDLRCRLESPGQASACWL